MMVTTVEPIPLGGVQNVWVIRVIRGWVGGMC